MPISTSQIIRKIGSRNLSLYKGEGYWYFVYDDCEKNNIWADESVPCFKLNQMSLEQWVEIGKDFVVRTIEEQKQKDILDNSEK